MSGSRPRCAWCHDDLAPDAIRLACPACGTLLHPECARALVRGCPTLGCPAPAGPPAAGPCPGHDRPLSPAGRALLRLLGWATRGG